MSGSAAGSSPLLEGLGDVASLGEQARDVEREPAAVGELLRRREVLVVEAPAGLGARQRDVAEHAAAGAQRDDHPRAEADLAQDHGKAGDQAAALRRLFDGPAGRLEAPAQAGPSRGYAHQCRSADDLGDWWPPRPPSRPFRGPGAATLSGNTAAATLEG